MYAVGHLCDIDAGYAIWSQEDFTRLFWSDAEQASVSSLSNMLLENANDVSSVNVDGERQVAIATVGSREIIEKDEECLRRVFLLEQRRLAEMKTVAQGQLDSDLEESRQDEKDSGCTPNLKAMSLNTQTQQPEQPSTIESKKKKKEKWSKKDFSKIKRKPRKSNLQPALPLPPAPSYNRGSNVGSSTSSPLRRTHSEPVKPVPLKVSLDQLLEKSTPSTIKQPQHQLEPQSMIDLPQTTTAPLQPCLTSQQLLSNHLPPLQNLVISSISFPNLRTSEFFSVFFADDAPYSMRDFQLKRGDVDVLYGPWGRVKSGIDEDAGDWIEGSLKGGGRVKREWVRERKMEFSTLTKR